MASNTRPGLWLGVLFVYFLLMNYVVLHSPITLFPTPDAPSLSQAVFLSSNAKHPSQLPAHSHENATDQWQPVSLPHDWYQSQQRTQQIWYSTKIHLPRITQSSVWALYLPSVTHNAAVYLNGTWIGQGGDFNDPVSRHHNEPLLFPFSSTLLKEGENQLLIRVKASHPKQGLFDAFYVAPLNQLEKAYWWKRIVRVDVVQWLTLIMYSMAALLLVFWLVRPQDKIYGLFALELILWATHNLNLFISDIPVSAKTWEAMTMSTLGWTVATMIVFNHRYVGVGMNAIDRAVMLYSAAGIGIFFLPDIGSILTIGYGIWDAFLILFGSYAIYFLIVQFWKTQDRDVYLMLLAGVPILVFGFHDILTVNHFRDRREGLIIQYSLIPAVLLFSWFLIKRFVGSLNQAEQMTSLLEHRVKQRETELAQQFERLKQLEQQQLLAQERERIMRDMHDGIGGQLVSVISLLQNQKSTLLVKTRQKIESSLTDLRLVIDSLDPLMCDLTSVLGMMRGRINDQLRCTNIQLHWQVEDLPTTDDLSPHKSLHIMRIVQEAINNVVKHSSAQQVWLRTGHSNEALFIRIQDDGNGFSANDNQSHSRGLTNMHYRAQQIGADLAISSDDCGTSVTLQLAVNNS